MNNAAPEVKIMTSSFRTDAEMTPHVLPNDPLVTGAVTAAVLAGRFLGHQPSTSRRERTFVAYNNPVAAVSVCDPDALEFLCTGGLTQMGQNCREVDGEHVRAKSSVTKIDPGLQGQKRVIDTEVNERSM